MNQEKEVNRLSRREFISNSTLAIFGGIFLANGLYATAKQVERYIEDSKISAGKDRIRALTSEYEYTSPPHAYAPFQTPNMYSVVRRTPTPQDLREADKTEKRNQTLQERSDTLGEEANIAAERAYKWGLCSAAIAVFKGLISPLKQ